MPSNSSYNPYYATREGEVTQNGVVTSYTIETSIGYNTRLAAQKQALVNIEKLEKTLADRKKLLKEAIRAASKPVFIPGDRVKMKGSVNVATVTKVEMDKEFSFSYYIRFDFEHDAYKRDPSVFEKVS